jgi:hypothetical protein
MTLELALFTVAVTLLALWVVSSARFRATLLVRYHLHYIYSAVLFLIVIVPGWRSLSEHRWLPISVFIVLLAGDLWMQRDAGWWDLTP